GYLNDLYSWLLRTGYAPYFANFGRNSDCPEILTKKLLLKIDEVYENTGRRVVLIGHSLGGTIAIAAAKRAPRKVFKIITLGSPIHNAAVNFLVFGLASLIGSIIRTRGDRPENCYTDRCNCLFVRSLPTPPPKSVEANAIYTREDRVVRWRCTVWNNNEGRNLAVNGTHVGLAFNPEVYRAIANILSETGSEQTPLLKVVT
ncbi:alpha/beta fold hydrolase, partial [Candidatus Curtissbacteria bacterium]|nr:alpha/beta fold hydrolase [Candidatus Curtissbacteria bacterium]